jgi:hypothetical protein
MVDEYHFLMKNETWDLAPRLHGKNVFKCQWSIRPNSHIKALLKEISLVW